MKQAYTIWAYSPSTGQRLREFDLTGKTIGILREAQNRADWFADRLNKTRIERDWIGEVRHEKLGLDAPVQKSKPIL